MVETHSVEKAEMEFNPQTQRRAWLPLTPSGVAAFAPASWFRVAQIQFVFALVAASTFVWAFHSTWGVAFGEAIPRLPAASGLQNGMLQWPGEHLVRLAENRYVSIVGDLDATGDLPSSSDFQIELGARQVRIRSLLGSAPIPYGVGWTVPLDRLEVSAWWGAWKPAVLAGLGLAVLLSLVAVWDLLALPYALVVRLIALAGRRQLTLPGAWRIGAAAQLPGVFIGCAGLLAYATGRIDLVRLIWVMFLQFPLAWFLLVLAPFRLRPPPPSPSQPSSPNPFVGSQNLQ